MLKKVLLNSTLLIVLLGLIAAPMASMTLLKLDESDNPIVLSSQDERAEESSTENGEVPEDIEELIRRLEQEMYQETLESSPEEELDILSP